MDHSFLIHSSADGHLGCFHVLAIINSAAMNIEVHVSLSDLASSVCMPRISGSYGSSISSFLRNLHTAICKTEKKERHWCTEQTFGFCGRRRGWDVQREQHWNKYTIKSETDHQPRLDAWDKCSGLVHWEDPEG